ncbi:peptidylprolyl isomerase [Sediminibacterium sp. KACHI17]|jgi:peptidyl-prolyl cis-trans isomerase A (cyclophilin A)|uniref:peptidylprolyl isomerase n=1 Tax=Sediminibacterium sp. KACHI17 TaxID=1751071 RepID=UPI003365569D
MKQLIFLFLLISLIACTETINSGNPHVVIETKYGEIELELYADKAPATTAAFLSYVDSGFYENTSFYRVLNVNNQPSNAPKTEILQGGLWRTKNEKARSITGIPHESTGKTGVKHKDGVISVARLAPGTAGSEFFICIDDQPGLDEGGENVEDKLGYAAFGKVIKGMSVVRKIYMQNDRNQYLDPPIAIYNVRRK